MADVELDAVSVTYGARSGRAVAALTEVTLRAGAGEVLAVCGRNGAGKTTLLDVVTGLRRPDRGSARLGGQAAAALDADGRSRLGVALADSGLPPAATPARLLAHLSRLHRHPVGTATLVERLDLGGLLQRRIRRLSSGQRQRLALACALVGRPQVLVLDEPTSFLDTEGRRTVVDLLRETAAGGACVLWTSHTLHDVARGSDRVAVLHDGRVLADATPAALTGAADVVRFEATPAADIEDLVRALPGTMSAGESAPGVYEVIGEGVDAGVLTTVATWQAAHGGSGRLAVGPRDLEDVLSALTTAPLVPR